MIENLLGGGGGGGGGTVDTIQAGTGISVNSTDPANPIITNTSLNTDEVAKVSSNDTTAGYLNGKLVAGTSITLTENNNGGNETLSIGLGSHTHAASDITSGVIATARLASSGTADATTFLRGDQSWASVSGGDTTYTVTAADAENTTTLTNLVSFTVPANTWNNWEVIFVDVWVQSSCASNSNLTTSITIGGTQHSTTTYAFTAGDGTRARYRHWFIRDGSNVRALPVSTNYTYGLTSINTLNIQTHTAYWNSATTATAATFTGDITINIRTQWAVAVSGNLVRILNARAYKPAGQTT